MPEQGLEFFASDLHQEILSRAGGGGDGEDGTVVPTKLREEAFTETVLELLDEHDEVDGWELCAYESRNVGPVPAARLSAWAMSGDGATLDLFVSLYHGYGTVVDVGKPEMRRHLDLLRGFLKRALDGFHTRMEEASDAFAVSRLIHDARGSLATVRLFFLTDGLVRSLDIEEVPLPGVEVRYVAWDLEKLSRLRVGQRALIELDLTGMKGGGIPCLESGSDDDEYRTYLAFVPATLLVRVYGEFGQRLLERNVRAFLQTKGKINKGLHHTIRDEPARFLAYNNGLCCTASEVGLEKANGGGIRITRISDFQIVNGGQTTASIFHAHKKDKLDIDGVVVQMKLSVIADPDKITEIVPMISRYANSQNKVNAADLAANGKLHRDLETQSRNVWAPAQSGLERGSRWYYERARGSYQDDKTQQGSRSKQDAWEVENPRHQKFTKTDFAKCEHAWLGLPHIVCKGAEKNFIAYAQRLEDDGEPDVDRGFFEQVVARLILWRSAEKIFDSLDLEGYRANSVAYAISWFAEHTGRQVDLTQIWKEQRIPDALIGAMEKLCVEAHRFLTTGDGNRGEFSKKVDSWTAFRGQRIKVGNEWEVVRGEKPATYPPPRPVPGAEDARSAIIELSAEQWFALAKWAKDRGFLEGWERALAFSLGRLVSGGRQPSDKQAVQGARIFLRARELGFH